MKKQITLPSGKLGQLGRINIELEMSGNHYDALTTLQGDHQEEVVLSILGDLMDEDPYQLTQIDLMYIFTLVKLATLGPNLTVNTACPAKIVTPSGIRVCSTPYKFTINLQEDDVEYFPKGEKVPTFTMKVGEKEETFELQLPTMAKEIECLGEFEKDGTTRREILSDKNKTKLNEYTKRRCILHLKTNSYTEQQLYEALCASSFKTITTLNERVLDLAKYGLKHKVYACTCKECGGKFNYRLPLLAGLSL